jgi:peptidyl-prolyl cis-trans isomerase C
MKAMICLTALVFLILFTSPVLADANVFAAQGGQEITQEEIDAAFSRIPEEGRLMYIRDGDKVDRLVRSLLLTRQIAAEARANGFDQDPIMAARLELAAEKELYDAWMEQVMENAPEADYEALAYEYYVANPEQFQSMEMVDVSHILIQSEYRNNAEALEKVTAIHEQLVEDPSKFDEFITEYSEDPAVSSNKGRYPNVLRGQMVKPFEDAAFALENEGDISEPVETQYGFHIIRLNQKNPPQLIPFEDVKARAMEQARARHLADYRKRYVARFASEPMEIPDGAVETMLKRHFGEDLEGASISVQ